MMAALLTKYWGVWVGCLVGIAIAMIREPSIDCPPPLAQWAIDMRVRVVGLSCTNPRNNWLCDVRVSDGTYHKVDCSPTTQCEIILQDYCNGK